ncbi:MAG: ERF family protein [Candidatus Pacearchaeota archaeon]|nr:ERF family protein [Candidatus Pacearchaeota archaeon]
MSDHKKSEQIVVSPTQRSIQGTPAAEIQAAPGLHPLLQAALQADTMSVEVLERMQVIQFKHEDREARKAYTKAKVALMNNLPAIISHDRRVDYPSKKGGRVHYTYATMAAAVKEVQPKLGEYGFSYQWIPDVLDNRDVKITFRLTHVQGHFEDFALSGPPDTAGGKDSLKALGSATSYLKRYTFCLGFGITTADMKDADDHSADREKDSLERIDRAATNKAVAYFEQKGLPLEEAVQQVGKPVHEWTTKDLDVLREFVKEKRQKPTLPELQDRVAIDSQKLWGGKWADELDRKLSEKGSNMATAGVDVLMWVINEISDMLAAIEEEKKG